MMKRFPIAPEGFLFIVPLLLASVISGLVGPFYLFVVFSILSLFAIYFFRNPRRDIPSGDRVVLSPADGRVLLVDRCREGRFLHRDTTKISIFMSLFDVHINRSPVSGIVENIKYHPGRFHLANRDKSSQENEQNALVVRRQDDLRVLFIQIAGFVARRIVCYPKQGDHLDQGQILGMIRFGSRLDIYLPEQIEPLVKPGDKVRGGESILGAIR
jgi:phosphatidylserine decarboxylase